MESSFKRRPVCVTRVAQGSFLFTFSCARSVAGENAPREAAISQSKTHFREIHFGRTLGSPPGLPGGGITGVLPASGAGARMAGSTSEGGHSTPSDSASLSPSDSLERPTVRPSGVVCDFVAPQRAEGWSGGGAVLSGGVAAVGGACAMATPGAMINSRAANKDGLHRIRQERRSRAIVPAQDAFVPDHCARPACRRRGLEPRGTALIAHHPIEREMTDEARDMVLRDGARRG